MFKFTRINPKESDYDRLRNLRFALLVDVVETRTTGSKTSLFGKIITFVPTSLSDIARLLPNFLIQHVTRQSLH